MKNWLLVVFVSFGASPSFATAGDDYLEDALNLTLGAHREIVATIGNRSDCLGTKIDFIAFYDTKPTADLIKKMLESSELSVAKVSKITSHGTEIEKSQLSANRMLGLTIEGDPYANNLQMKLKMSSIARQIAALINQKKDLVLFDVSGRYGEESPDHPIEWVFGRWKSDEGWNLFNVRVRIQSEGECRSHP